MMYVVSTWKLGELLPIIEIDMQPKELNNAAEKKQQEQAATDGELTEEEFDDVLKKVTRKTKFSEPNQNRQERLVF